MTRRPPHEGSIVSQCSQGRGSREHSADHVPGTYRLGDWHWRGCGDQSCLLPSWPSEAEGPKTDSKSFTRSTPVTCTDRRVDQQQHSMVLVHAWLTCISHQGVYMVKAGFYDSLVDMIIMHDVAKSTMSRPRGKLRKKSQKTREKTRHNMA